MQRSRFQKKDSSSRSTVEPSGHKCCVVREFQVPRESSEACVRVDDLCLVHESSRTREDGSNRELGYCIIVQSVFFCQARYNTAVCKERQKMQRIGEEMEVGKSLCS